jgi:hypothetical protein
MEAKPEMRGAWVKQALGAVNELAPPVAQRVLAALPPGLADKIGSAGDADWLPAEWTVAVVTAVYQTLSREEATRLWTLKADATFRQPLIAETLKSAFSVLEVSPDTVLRWAVKTEVGVGLVIRNCGKLELESITSDAAVLLWRDLPPVLFDSDAWCESGRGTFAGIVALGNARLESFAFERTTVDKAVRALRYRLSWRAGR